MALAFCVLMGTAAIACPVAAFAQDENQEETQDSPDAAPRSEEMTDEGMADQDSAESGDEETAAAAEDDSMPPMATGGTEPLPEISHIAPPHASRVNPSVSQLQTVDMNEIGERRAADPAAEAAAQEGEAPYVDPAGDTHPALFLTPDKSRIIRLEKPASTVVVGNVAHVNVLIDSPHTLVVVPRQTGASYFTVMDENRRVIMQRHVIVGPAPQYVRVRRSCGNSAGCEETSVFYCPNGMCHQVTTMQQPGNAPTQTTIAGSTGGGVGSMGGSEMGTETYEGGMPFGEFPSIPFIPFPFSFPGTGGE